MEEKKYSFNIEETGKIFVLIRAMKGSGAQVAAYKLLRDEVSGKLQTAFPELLEKADAWPEKAVRRGITLNARQLRAIGHGLVDLISRDECNGVDVSGVMTVADLIRIRGYVYSMVKPDAADELPCDLDDEQVDSDPPAPKPE